MEVRAACASCGRNRQVTWVRGALRCDDCRRAMWNLSAVVAPKPVREIEIEANGRRYKFRSKAEARRTLHHVLGRKRLPAEIAAQIEGTDGR